MGVQLHPLFPIQAHTRPRNAAVPSLDQLLQSEVHDGPHHHKYTHETILYFDAKGNITNGFKVRRNVLYVRVRKLTKEAAKSFGNQNGSLGKGIR